ncbi:hypothetical protein IFVP408_C2120096 [Vibrio parahaemolyticus]
MNFLERPNYEPSCKCDFLPFSGESKRYDFVSYKAQEGER